MSKLKLFSFHTIFIWCSISCFANVLLLEQQQSLSLEDYLYLTAPAEASSTLEDIISNQHLFSPLKDTPTQTPTPYPIWAKFDIQNKADKDIRYTDWVLRLSLTFTDIEVYTVENNQIITIDKSGFFTPLSERDYIPSTKGNYIKLRLIPNKSYTIYAKLICERTTLAPEFDLQLINAEKFQQTISSKQRWSALYLGFLIMMLVYNLLIYFFAKDRTFLFYAIYLGSIGWFSAYNSGDLADIITPHFFPNHPHLIYYFKLPVYICMASYLFFLRSFLDLGKLMPTWDKYLQNLAYLAFFCLVLDGTIMTATNFSYKISDTVLISYAVVFVLASFSILPPLFRSDDFKRYFIIFGVVAMGIGTLLTVWARLQSIDFSVFYFRIGSIIEIIAFSLGLAYRHIQNEKEKQKVYYDLEKNKLIQEQELMEVQQMKELNQLKARLYTNITHEFRTPLTVIMGMVGSIKGHKKATELIHRNSNNLLQLVNQLLDIAKADKAKLTLTEKPVELKKWLKYFMDSFYSLAQAKNIRLQFHTTISSSQVAIDEDKLKHILQNLLSNAIKFTPAYGTINVTAEIVTDNQVDYLQLLVKDNGKGISPQDLPHVFDRFYQSTQESSLPIAGTGIGLSLAKEFVEFMTGTIEVESQLGRGTEFIVTLPVTKIVSPTPLSSEPYHSLPQPYSIGDHPVAYEPNKKPIILVIEDNIDVFIYIQHCLEQHYNLHLAQDGKIGIKMAKELIPDIILSDVMMPEKNGYDVCKILKRDEKTSHIPIILLTAKVTQEDKLIGLQQGVDAYLTKPFDKKELLIRISKIIEAKKRLQDYYSTASFSEPVPHSAGTQSELIFLEKLNGFIESNLLEADFSMTSLSKFMNMSQIQVYRKIKSLTDQTPTQYIRAKRLNKAVELLQGTQLNISEIAYQVGYSDPNYFSRTFHKEYGQTPSSFRST